MKSDSQKSTRNPGGVLVGFLVSPGRISPGVLVSPGGLLGFLQDSVGECKIQTEYDFKELCLRFDKPRKLPDPKEKHPQEHQRHKGKSRELGLAKEDYSQLRQQWHNEFMDIMGGTQDRLPSWREVNHEIHLIDDNKRYNYHLPRVPHAFCEQFHENINRYVNAGWWEP